MWCLRGVASSSICSSRSGSSSSGSSRSHSNSRSPLDVSSIVTTRQSPRTALQPPWPPAHSSRAAPALLTSSPDSPAAAEPAGFDSSGAAAAAAAAAAAGEMDLSSGDSEPTSPSAHMFGDGDDDVGAEKHVLLVVPTLDTFVCYLSVGEQEFHKADLAELLLDNPTLFRWATCLDSHSPAAELLHWREQQKTLAAAASTVEQLPLGEWKHMLLHLLLRLHQRAHDRRVPRNVRVSILCWHSLSEPLLARLATPAQMSQTSRAAWAFKRQTAQTAWSCLHSSAFHLLHVRPHTRKTAYRGATRPASAKSQSAYSACRVTKSSRFAYRFVSELPSDLPVDALFFPSLMWYSELAPQEHLKCALDKLLRDIGPTGLSASLYPPLLWDDLCEQKQDIYAAFADCMIPCQWIALASLDERHVSSLAEQLWNAATSAPLPAGATQNVFLLKAAWGCAKSGVKQLKPTTQGKEAALLELCKRLTECAQAHHQRIFTMQPYFASLVAKEFRIWCVASDCGFPSNVALHSAPSLRKRWRIASGVQTCFVSGSTLLCAEAVCPYDAVTFAVWEFVEGLFVGAHKAFFDRLLDGGMPGVRIDCFYCEETRRVMLNEITPPQDTMMFTHKHGLPLIKGVMRALADGLFAELA